MRTMFTHCYRGMFIHGYADAPECTVSGYGLYGKTFKSYRAAQLAITKACKLHDSAMETLAKRL